MYNAEITKTRIMELCVEKSAHQMLKDCSLGVNAIRQIGARGMSSYNLAKIADYLDCSVDYLLGRTDNPIAHRVSTIIASDRTMKCYNSIMYEESESVHNNLEESKETAAVLIKLFYSLSKADQAKLLVYANKLEKGIR